jgi:alpha-L-rhamnosidase
MRSYNRRDFIKSTGCFGVISLVPINTLLPVCRKTGTENPPVPEKRGLSFDPWLDKNCKILHPPKPETWEGLWMWYPGQKTAHIHSRCVRDAMERCTNMGYPGNFPQPLYQAFFRKQVTVERDSEINWAGPLSRIRMNIDGVEGDITTRKNLLKAGTHLIEAKVDFSGSLPCILIEGTGLSSPDGWMASLDQHTWVEPEFEDLFNSPFDLPDQKREVVVEIPVHAVISTVNARKTETGFVFSDAGSVIVDFWHDELGRLSFSAKGKGQLNIHSGESEAEVRDTDPGHFEQQPVPAIDLKGASRSALTPERCTRFAQFRSTGPCTIENLVFKASVTPVEYKGTFSCSDEELNTIWEAGAATIHSCMHDFYLDGIKRDALSWADAVMGMFAGDCVFYDAGIARNSIVSQLLPLQTNSKDFGIVDYPAFTYLGFEHDYHVRGELAFPRAYKQHMYDLLDLYNSLQDERGFISGKNFKNQGFFADWSVTPETGPDRFGIPCYSQMLIMKSFEIGACFARLFQDTHQAERYAQIALKLRKNIPEVFRDPASGAFLNGIDSNGKMDRRLTSFAQVWGILFDLVEPEGYEAIFENVLDHPRREKLSISLNQLFEGQAYARAGRTGSFLARLKKYWGGMIQEGYSRFAEDIRPWQNPVEQLGLYGRPYANSLCHVWAGAAPVLAMSRGVLGIIPAARGFSECIIHPQMADLEWMKGDMPVPSGKISLELHKKDGGKLTLPAGVKASLAGIKTKNGQTEMEGPGVFQVINHI